MAEKFDTIISDELGPRPLREGVLHPVLIKQPNHEDVESSETATPPVVLVIEDEPALLMTLEHKLTREGYAVLTATRGDDGLALAREKSPDVIVLDIMLPGLDGLQVCRLLRRDSDVPIMLLTALGSEGDRVAGLDTGADDYLTKPFGLKELLARVRALLRRRPGDSAPATADDILQFGDIELDMSRRELRCSGDVVHVKPKEFELLRYLAHHAGHVVTREQIVESVWGRDYAGGVRTVDVHMRWLRQKIEKDPARPARIKTVRGAGYLFEG